MSSPDTQSMADAFVDALLALEGDRKLEEIVALFAEEAELRTASSDRVFAGTRGAREFWTAYRDAFGDEMHTTFQTVAATDGDVTLQWRTQADSRTGEPIDYEGVSVLKVASGRVWAFRAYFDPAALSPMGRPSRSGAT